MQARERIEQRLVAYVLEAVFVGDLVAVIERPAHPHQMEHRPPPGFDGSRSNEIGIGHAERTHPEIFRKARMPQQPDVERGRCGVVVR